MGVEIPSEPKKVDYVDPEITKKPTPPVLPEPGSYGASDQRAILLGLYAYELSKWGDGLLVTVKEREIADEEVYNRVVEERRIAKEKVEKLQLGNK